MVPLVDVLSMRLELTSVVVGDVPLQRGTVKWVPCGAVTVTFPEPVAPAAHIV